MPLTRTDLTTLSQTNLPSNNQNQIRASSLRAVVQGLIDNLALTTEAPGNALIEYPYSVAQPGGQVRIPFDRKVALTAVKPIRNVLSVILQLISAAGSGLTHSDVAGLNADIAALTPTQLAGGYIIQVSVAFTGSNTEGQFIVRGSYIG